MSNVDLSILLNVVADIEGYEVSRFGESIHNYPNRIKLAGSQRQTYNDVHTNVIPLQSGILKGCNRPPGFI
jgi:hypothetical protein